MAAPYRACIRIRSFSPPSHVHPDECVSRKSGIAQDFLIAAIQEILDTQNQIDRWLQSVTSCDIDFPVAGIPHDSKTDTIGILPLADERGIDVHKAATKNGSEIQ